jgi:alkylation response protein AidB-like acyl-CoA dehydrogenase
MSRRISASVYTEAEILRLIRLRTVSAVIKGRAPGPEASIRKALADEHGQHIMAVAKDLHGAHGMLAAHDMWEYGFLFAPALTIGGGTSEVQRNIIGERVLGLPHDIDVEVGKTWSETRKPSSL